MNHREKIRNYNSDIVKIFFKTFSVLVSFLFIGCLTTAQDKEYQKNKEIVNSAIEEGKPKSPINITTAVIADTIRRQH